MSVIRANDKPPQPAHHALGTVLFKKVSSGKLLMSKQILFLYAGG